MGSNSRSRSSQDTTSIQNTSSETITTDFGAGNTGTRSVNIGDLGLGGFFTNSAGDGAPAINRSNVGDADFSRELNLAIAVDDASDEAIGLANNSLGLAAESIARVGAAFDGSSYLAEEALRNTAQIAGVLTDSLQEQQRIASDQQAELFGGFDRLFSVALDNAAELNQNALDIAGAAIGSAENVAEFSFDASERSAGRLAEVTAANATGFSDTQINAFVMVAGLAVAAIVIPQIVKRAA